MWSFVSLLDLWAKQRLDRAALVHRSVALSHLVERQGQVEDLAGIDLLVPYQANKVGQEAAHRRGATMEIDVREEQPLAVELDSVRDANVAHGPTRAGGTDRLHHRLLGADALQHRVSTDAVRQLLDAGHALVAALGHDIGRAELAGELLPRLVTAHCDDTFSTHLLGGQH